MLHLGRDSNMLTLLVQLVQDEQDGDDRAAPEGVDIVGTRGLRSKGNQAVQNNCSRV